MAIYQNLNTVTTTTAALADADKIPLIQSNTLKTCTLSALVDNAKAASLKAFEAQWLDMMTEGAYIATTVVQTTTRMWRFYTPSQWLALKKTKADAEGVMIIEADHRLLVANTQTKVTWSTVKGIVTTAVTQRAQGYSDWAGKDKTKAIATAAVFANDTASNNAAKYCYNYATAHVKANSWWLPSFAEIYMVARFRDRINALRSIIGYDPLPTDAMYATSTEVNATVAFDLGLSDYANPCWDAKVEGKSNVLPITNIDFGFVYGQAAND